MKFDWNLLSRFRAINALEARIAERERRYAETQDSTPNLTLFSPLCNGRYRRSSRVRVHAQSPARGRAARLCRATPTRNWRTHGAAECTHRADVTQRTFTKCSVDRLPKRGLARAESRLNGPFGSIRTNKEWINILLFLLLLGLSFLKEPREGCSVLDLLFLLNFLRNGYFRANGSVIR